VQIKVAFSHYQGKAEETVLLDTGATKIFIDHTTIVKLHLGMKKLPYPRPVFNVDRTLNQHRTITHACDLLVTKGNKQECQCRRRSPHHLETQSKPLRVPLEPPLNQAIVK